jgi:hypothetical protein
MISVYYNGVILKDCVVRRFQQDVVRDESDTDVMYSKFIVTVEATAVEQYYQDINTGDGYPRNTLIRTPNRQVNLVGALDQIARKLSENRKDFWMVLGGQTPGTDAYDREETMLIASGTMGDPDDVANVMDLNPRYPAQGNTHRYAVVDVENGPQTEDIAVEQLFGGTAARVSVTFKVARSLCLDYDDENTPPSPYVYKPDLRAGAILNNRWQMSETKDANWATERRIEGTLRTRHSDEFAQLFRTAVLPSLADGYQRVQQHFATDKSNTTLRYVIIDKQRYAAPPGPALDWQATHTETTTANGARQAANFSIKLIGPQNVDKRDLIGAAGKVLTLRIQDIQDKEDGAQNHTILEEMNIVDELEKPVISLNARVTYSTADYTWLGMRVKTMCGDRTGNLTGANGVKDYDPRKWPKPRAYESERPVTQLACYLQNPCSVWHGMVQQPEDRDYPLDTERPEPQDSYPPDYYDFQPNKDVDESQDDYGWMKPNPNYPPEDPKADVFNFPYTSYEIATTWETSTGNLHLPYSVIPPATPSEGDPDTATALRMNQGLSRLFYEITATRTGRYPTIPPITQVLDDSENEIEWTLLDHSITMRPPEILADGSRRRFGLALKLIYGGTKSINQQSLLNPGASPIAKIGAGDDSSTVSLTSITDEINHILSVPIESESEA